MGGKGFESWKERLWGQHNILFKEDRSAFPESGSRDVDSTIYLHLVARLRMSGDIPLRLLIYAFMAWAGPGV